MIRKFTNIALTFTILLGSNFYGLDGRGIGVALALDGEYFKVTSSSTIAGSKAYLYWSVVNRAQCQVTNSANTDVYSSPANSTSGSWLTNPINASTTFTLKCDGNIIGAPIMILAVSSPSFNGDFESGDVVGDVPPNNISKWSVDNYNQTNYDKPGIVYEKSSTKAKGGTFQTAVGRDSQYALKLSTNSWGYPIAYSVPMPAKIGDAFRVDFDYKVEGAAIGQAINQFIGFEEYFGQEINPRAYPWLTSNISPADANGEWHSNSATIYGIKAPDISFIKIKLGGPVGIDGGSITYDNIKVTPISFEPKSDEIKGCVKNSLTSKCADLGSDDDINVDLSVPSDISAKKSETEGARTTTYREVNNNKTMQVTMDSWNVDANGLPNTDLMLEVRYKDSFVADVSLANYYTYIFDRERTAKLIARTDWGGVANSAYLNPLLGLGEYGQNNWRVAQVVIPKTKWQMIKSIEGKFQFRIDMPNVGTDPTKFLVLPIDYISLTEISAQDVADFQQKQRDLRGFRQNDYIESKIRPIIPGDFGWFASPSATQIFPNYFPAQETLSKPIGLKSAQGQIEPGNFSIITNNALTNVEIVATDLLSNGSKISADQIEMYKTVYEYSYWSRRRNLGDSYGLQPNRYEKFEKASIPADTTQQFYFTVKIPDNLAGGVYSGTIKIIIDGQEKAEIPLSIDVLGMHLADPGYTPLVFNNPNMDGKTTFEYSSKLPEAIAAHGMQSVTFFTYFCKSINVSSACDKDANGMPIFNTTFLESFSVSLQRSIDQGMVKDRAFYMQTEWVARDIIKSLGLVGSLRENLNSQLFEQAYNIWIDKIEEIAFQKNIKIIYNVTDETNGNLEKRIFADKLYRLMKARNLTTWQTYAESDEDPMACTDASLCGKTIAGVLAADTTSVPSLGDLIDLKVWTPSNLKNDNVLLDPPTFGYYTTHFSQVRNPVYARFMQGIYAVKTGSKVVANYALMHIIANPYDEFDNVGIARFPSSVTDYILFYPSWDKEVIPSTAWEAARDGIDDAKWIATLQGLIALNPDSTVAVEAKNYLANLLAGVNSDFIAGYANKAGDYGFADVIVRSISENNSTDPAIFDTIRSKVFDYIKQLRQAVVTVSTNRTIVAAGGTIEMIIEVTNPYDSAITNLNVTLPLPAGTVFDSASDGGSLSLSGLDISWPEISQLAPGQVQTFTFKVRVNG